MSSRWWSGIALLLHGACATEATPVRLVADTPPLTVHAARTWRPAPIAPFAAAAMMLLTDGTVMVQELSTERWWRLTPDVMGDYGNGTWSRIASMPPGYSPQYYASAVLVDGRVIVMGGEYIDSNPTWSKLGALYDPVADAWHALQNPPGWTTIGDASGMVLPDGTFLLSDCCTTKLALFDERVEVWTPTGSGKLDINDEESWAMLPDGTLLTIDTNNTAVLTQSELYTPSSGAWTSAGLTPVQISDTNADPNNPGTHEIGPEVLQYDGTVLALGGNGHNVIFDTKTATWSTAPDLPMRGGQLTVSDGPAAMLPNGNVLLAAGPGFSNPPTSYFEWDGGQFTMIDPPPGANSEPSYSETMLVLPTGEVLLSDFTQDVELYTPAPGHPDAAVPMITRAPELLDGTSTRTATPGIEPARGPTTAERPVATLYLGRSYRLEVDRMNGVNQGAYYGDDVQAYTNYPLVRLTSAETGHVQYCRTHAHSNRSIAPDAHGTTEFDVPATAEPGLATLEVVANGIASPALSVNVR